MGRKVLLALVLAMLGAYAYSQKRGEAADASLSSAEENSLNSETENGEDYGQFEDPDATLNQDEAETDPEFSRTGSATESTHSTSSSAAQSSGYGVPSPSLAPRVSSMTADDEEEEDDDALEEEIAARDAAAARERIRSREESDSYSSNAMPFLPLNPRAKRLSENWNFQAPGLTKEEIAPMLAQNQPKSISYFGDSGIMNISPSKTAQGAEQSDKTLNIASESFITNTQSARESTIAKNAGSGSSANPSATPAPDASSQARLAGNNAQISTLVRLPSDAFEIESFTPGLRDDKKTVLKPMADDLQDAISKQDYDTNVWFDARKPDEVKTYLSKVLSLGHGGMLILKVKNNGYIVDEPGADFALLENAFKTSGGNIYQEYGVVGVSNSLDEKSVKWFPCNPSINDLRWCFGAVSGEDKERIDVFDLSVLKDMKRAKYIWIRDVGNNQNLSSQAAIPTEGCDLDYVRLDHAYSTK